METDFVVCHNCGSQNSSSANYCFKCAVPLKFMQQPIPSQIQSMYQTQQPNEKGTKGWHIALLIVGSVLIVSIIINTIITIIKTPIAGNNVHLSSFKSLAVSTIVTVSPTTSPSPSEASRMTNIGETAESEGVEITVLAIKYLDGTDYIKPDDGQTFLSIDVKIENTSRKQISTGQSRFGIQTSNGEILNHDYSASLVDSEKKALPSIDLAAGGFTEGTIYFQVPENDNNLILIYKINYIDTEKNVEISLVE